MSVNREEIKEILERDTSFLKLIKYNDYYFEVLIQNNIELKHHKKSKKEKKVKNSLKSLI